MRKLIEIVSKYNVVQTDERYSRLVEIVRVLLDFKGVNIKLLPLDQQQNITALFDKATTLVDALSVDYGVEESDIREMAFHGVKPRKVN